MDGSTNDAPRPDGALDGVLAGKRILVVEDESIVAMLVEDVLTDLGAAVVGPASRVAEALGLVGAGGVDAALLDVNLAGETTTAVAEELGRRNIPFAFATGYGAAGLPPGFAGHPVLQKPFLERELHDMLARVLAG